jgi:hypothetical protein
MRFLTLAALSTQLLAGCATHLTEPSLAACGEQPDSLEGHITAAPEKAFVLRTIADANRFFHPTSPPFHTEIWVALKDGRLMLCRADSRRGSYVAGEWWIFDPAASRHQLVDHSGWLVQQ